MTVNDLCRAIAIRLGQVPGVAYASYPEQNKVPASPCVFVIPEAGTGPSVTKIDTRRQLEQPLITIRILVKSLKETPREKSRIDALIDPIKDALDPVAFGGSVNSMFVGLDGHVDRLWSQVLITRGTTEDYAGEFCYAADLVIDPKFHRTPGPSLPATVLT